MCYRGAAISLLFRILGQEEVASKTALPHLEGRGEPWVQFSKSPCFPVMWAGLGAPMLLGGDEEGGLLA